MNTDALKQVIEFIRAEATSFRESCSVPGKGFDTAEEANEYMGMLDLAEECEQLLTQLAEKRETRTPKLSFSSWLGGSGFNFYLSWDRYARYTNHGFVAVACTDDDDVHDRVRDSVEALTLPDPDMLVAVEYLDEKVKENTIFLRGGSTPARAMANLEEALMNYRETILKELDAQGHQVYAPTDGA